MNKKTFCVLEQSGEKDNPLTQEKKDLFTTEFSDFYRLNWKLENDPLADFVKLGALWSEGRSLLWEKVPKIYDYYIFTDDDIVFTNKKGSKSDIPNTIRILLEEHKPLSATFYDPGQWAFDTKYFDNSKNVLDKKAFPIAGFDLQVHIFSQNYANYMFPVIYHGADRCMWYSHWICNKLYPLKQMCFNSIEVSNTRDANHYDNATPLEADAMVWKFFKNIRKNDRIWSFNDFAKKTKKVSKLDVDKSVVKLTEKDLKKVLKEENRVFKSRSSTRNEKNRINLRDKVFYFINMNNLIHFVYYRAKNGLRKFGKYILKK